MANLKDILMPEGPTLMGEVTVWLLDEKTGHKRTLFTQLNQIQYSWAYIVAKAVGQGDPTYRIGGMYIEYKNVASPGDTVSVPSYTRGAGLSYYTSLASTYDYLRVPLSALPTITIQSGYESYFTAPEGNVMTFFAQTSGTTGELGRAFSDGSNSKAFGVALVATPDWSDSTQDVIFARTYFDTGDQQLKVAESLY
jgi:hypothetical protein